MSTIEDFKNAPIGATAIRKDRLMAIKIGDGERYWLTPVGTYLDDEEMMILGYTLKQIIPTTAHEALDLAWDFAHEVKPGQVIPKGTRFLEVTGTGLKEYTAQTDFKISPVVAPRIRTLEPLPEPEPDWIDAPAVMARVHNWHSCADPQVFTRYDFEGEPSKWVCNEEKTEFNWIDLVDVTPLYPKGQEA